MPDRAPARQRKPPLGSDNELRGVSVRPHFGRILSNSALRRFLWSATPDLWQSADMKPMKQIRCGGSRTTNLMHDLSEPRLQRGRCGICREFVPFESVDGVWVPSYHFEPVKRPKKLLPASKSRNAASGRQKSRRQSERLKRSHLRV